MLETLGPGGVPGAERVSGAPHDGQAELFGEVLEPEIVEADADLPLPAARTGKGGRPKGSRNRRTEEMVQFVLGQHRSPLIGLAQVWSRSAEQLACELKLFRRDDEGRLKLDQDGNPILRGDALQVAFQMQLQAMNAALPYLHQKLPIALDVKAKSAGMIVIGQLEGVMPGEDGTLQIGIGEPVSSGDDDCEGNQSFTAGDATQSDAQKSDAQPNPLNQQDDDANGI